jgi:hypothetical protein
MALEREEQYKKYTVAIGALKTFIGAGGAETVTDVILDDRLQVKTSQGDNPLTVRTYYINLPEARDALSISDGESFSGVDFSDDLVITTIKVIV